MAVEVFIVGAPPVMTEGGFLDKITLVTSSPVPFDEVVTVEFTISPGTAQPKLDYDYPSVSAIFNPETGVYTDRISIPGGASIGSFLINVIQDDLEEDSEAFVVELTEVSPNATLGANSSTTITIEDDDTVVTEPTANPVGISAISNAVELGGDGQFEVSLTQIATVNTIVSYTVSGTATAGSDYSPIPETVTIPAGSLSALIDVTVVDDSLLENDETVVVTLNGITGDEGVVLGDNTTATVTISDDSSIVYRVNAGGPEIAAIDDGPNWLADGSFLANPGSNSVFKTPAIEPGDMVPLGVPGDIFKTERFDRLNVVNDANLQYAFDVTPGVYEVRLYMGNGYAGTSMSGERVFDVAIEGEIPSNLDNVDLSAEFGHQIGGVISNQIVVTDNVLDIEFLHDTLEGVENPLINGIEIIQMGDVTPPPTVSVIGESFITGESSRAIQTTLTTSEPVPQDEVVNITFEIVPNVLIPEQVYTYSSASKTFDPETGVYQDTISIPSGFSAAEVSVNILDASVQDDDRPYTIRIIDVDGANFEVGVPQLPVRVEAEAFNFSNYQLGVLTAASGGQVLKFSEGATETSGTITLEIDSLTGFLPGEYDIIIGTYDALFPGGQSSTTFSAELNMVDIGEVSLRPPIMNEATALGLAAERTIATGVQLGAGDSLTITGFDNLDEAFWLDYVQFNHTSISGTV